MGCTLCRSSNPCRCGEDTLAFPAGPPGPPGPLGPTGPVGATGVAGATGTNGANGPTTVTKFVKDINPGSGTNVSLMAVTAAELTGAGMLRNVYNANTSLDNQTPGTMDFVYEIWFRDPAPGNPPFLSATEGTSPRVTAVNIDSLGNIHAVFATGGGSYRIIIEG